MKIETKEQFIEYTDTLYKRGARFEFEYCEVILLDNVMLVWDKKAVSRFLVDTRTGDCFWLYDEEVHKDNVLLENESEAWTMVKIRQACRNLPKHKAEKIMRVLEDENDDGIIFTPPSEIGYLEIDRRYLDWQKQIMCGDMPCEQHKKSAT